MGLADIILPEPLGGSHNDYEYVSKTLRKALLIELDKLKNIKSDDLIANRIKKYDLMGKWSDG